MPTETLLAERVAAIERLLKIFRYERAIYMSVTIISLVVLLASGTSLLLRNQAGPVEITGLFGSSGAVTFTAGRLLRMWSEALRLLGPSGGNPNGD